MNVEKLQIWAYVISLVGAGVFWVATMYGLPPRVEHLEKQISEHESRLGRSDVKLDMIADDVKSIKVMLLHSPAK